MSKVVLVRTTKLLTTVGDGPFTEATNEYYKTDELPDRFKPLQQIVEDGKFYQMSIQTVDTCYLIASYAAYASSMSKEDEEKVELLRGDTEEDRSIG